MLDKIIDYLSPEWGMKRRYARKINAVSDAYNVGSTTRRRTQHFAPALRSSPNQDYSQGTQAVSVARCADLYRNEPLARAAVNRRVFNSVGTGITVQAKIDHEYLGLTQEDATKLNRDLDMGFKLHSQSCDISLNRQLNLNEIQHQTLLSMANRGDCFVNSIFLPRPGSLFSLRLQVIEGDRVSNPGYTADSEKIVRGIEYGPDGEEAFYYVSNLVRAQYNFPTRWQKLRVWGENTGRRLAFHIFDQERPELARGIPYLAPVAERIKFLSELAGSELDRALISSFFTVFVKSEAGNVTLPSESLLTQDTQIIQQEQISGEISLGPGASINLASNEDVQFADPKSPNGLFEPFFMALATEIGAATNVPVEMLLLKFSTSYTAARAAIIQAYKHFDHDIRLLIQHLVKPVYELYVDERVAMGDLPVSNYNDPRERAAWARASYVPAQRASIDEVKDIEAATKRVDLGVSNRQIESERLQTGDINDILAQAAVEAKLLEKAGIQQKQKEITNAVS